ncbi:MAG: HAMP domain-containing protein [Candidatus Kuenenia sp.]|nr:HAMP domain-containing protein [Candidatus Kuenenia hertensis]
MWFLNSLKVGKKLLVLTIFFLCVIAGITAYTVITMQKQKADSNVINLAGAQRMLIQKMSKEVNQVAQGDGASIDVLRKTSEEFNKVLKGLVDGDPSLNLPKAETPDIAKALQTVSEKWEPFYSNLKYIVDSSLSLIKSKDYVLKNNVKLFNLANDTVMAMGEEQSSPEAVAVAGRLRALSQRTAKAAMASAIMGDGKDEALEELSNFSNLYSDILDGLLNGSAELNLQAETSEKVRTKLMVLKENSHQFLQSIERILELSPNINKNNDYVNANNLDLLKIMNEAVMTMALNSESKARSMILIEFIIFPIILAIGLVVSFAISRQITVPLRKTVNVLNNLSKGDLTQKELEIRSKDEIGDMGISINAVLNNLKSALTQVKMSAGQVATAANQISSASQELAESSHSQASTLEEISATIEEMSSMTSASADNAQQANALARRTREAAENGNQLMNGLVCSMEDLVESSSQTSKIIKVIDDIAFQTNLLALNAAVEAARAGDYGKGFAVVAEEVRNLAQRSASAARETSELIEKTIKQVEKGRDMSNQTAQAFLQITEESKKTADIVSEITSASQEQAQGLSNINIAMTDLDKGTQKIAANSEESASASGELSDQARELDQMLNKFKITEGETKYTQPRPAKALKTAKNLMLPRASGRAMEQGHEELIPMNKEEFEDF